MVEWSKQDVTASFLMVSSTFSLAFGITADETYPFVFMDAIHYKVRDEGHVVSKAAYVALGVNMEGYKEILGIWIGETESSKFWLSVMNELKSRGVKQVYLFCVDGLAGFREAIGAAFPKAVIQRCIIQASCKMNCPRG